MSELQDKLKSRMTRDTKFLGVAVKVDLMSSRQKCEFIDTLLAFEDVEEKGAFLGEQVCTHVFEMDGTTPAIPFEYLNSDDMSDPDAAKFIKFVLAENGIDLGDSTASDGIEKN